MKTDLIDITENDVTLSLVAHQLRSPINTILHSIALLKKNNSVDNKDDYILDYIEKSSFKMLKIAQNVFETIRIENNEHTIVENTYDYIDYVHNLVVSSIPYAKVLDIKLKFISTIDILHIPFDKNKTTIVIMNLISNAIKFSKKNSTVTISITSKDNSLITSIIDSGAGVSKDKRPFLFKKYYTSATAYSKNVIGCGLGLYVAMQNALEVNGVIKYFSAKHGAKFSFIFPFENSDSFLQLCDHNVGADNFFEQNVRIHLTELTDNKVH